MCKSRRARGEVGRGFLCKHGCAGAYTSGEKRNSAVKFSRISFNQAIGIPLFCSCSLAPFPSLPPPLSIPCLYLCLSLFLSPSLYLCLSLPLSLSPSLPLSLDFFFSFSVSLNLFYPLSLSLNISI